MNSQTLQAVRHTLETLNAAEYIIRLIHETRPPINKQIEGGKVTEEVRFYQAKNREGYNVYFRPVGYEYVLVDDLHRSTLDQLARLKPCLLIETSPGNYQAWLRLSQTPQNREDALNICQAVAGSLAADLGSAEPDHIGRLPGFTNRKPRHRREDGLFPFVKLHKWESRESTFPPRGGIVGQVHSPTKPSKPHCGRDRSREDFNLVCMLISQGKADDFIRDQLEATSLKAKEIKPSFDYIGKTIRNARLKLGR